MKKNRKILIILGIVLTIAVNTILESVYIFAEEGEVINVAPHVSFEVEPLKEINLVVGVGETNYSKNEIQALVNQLIIPKLRTQGIEANVNIENYDWHEPTAIDGKYYLVDRWQRTQSSSSKIDYVYPKNITDDPSLDEHDLNYKTDRIYKENRIIDIVATKYDRVVILSHERYYENSDDEETVHLNFYDGKKRRVYNIISGQVNHDGKRHQHTIENIKITEDDKVYYYTRHTYKNRFKSENYIKYDMNTRGKYEITEEEFNSVTGYSLVDYDYVEEEPRQIYVQETTYRKPHYQHKVAPNGYTINYYPRRVKHINESNGNEYYSTDYSVYCGNEKVFELDFGKHDKYDIVNFMPYTRPTNIKDVSNNFNSNKNFNFFCTIDKGEVEELMSEYMRSDKRIVLENFLRNDASYIAIGNSSFSSKYNSIISSNDNKGKYENIANINTALTNAANYIINQVINSNIPTNSILLGQSVKIKDYTYDDRESDSIYNETYEINHTNPYYYQNSTGKSANISTNNRLSDYTFDNTGEFEICYYAKDNPKNDNRFDNYRKISNIAKSKILVGRRPIADFALKYDRYNIIGYWDLSKDLDHTNMTNDGIAEWIWKYQDNEGIWINGFPLNKNKEDIKKIYLRVKDWDGFYSIPKIQELEEGYSKPKGFTDFLMNQVMYEGEENPITNLSQGDLTSSYLGELMSYWNILDNNETLIKDCGKITPNLSTLKEGQYKIKLKTVQEYYTSDGRHKSQYDRIKYCIKDLRVLKRHVITPPQNINHPPVAEFTVSSKQLSNNLLQYNNTSYDIDGDTLTNYWSYRYKNVNADDSSSSWSSWNGYTSNHPSSLQCPTNLKYRLYEIKLKVKDNGSPTNLYSSNEPIKEVKIYPYNSKPSSNFSINKTKILTSDEFILTDLSNANDSWDTIVQHIWQYSKNNGAWIDTDIRLNTFYEEGTFRIRHKVLDTGNILDTGKWSDWTYKTITVLPRNTKPTLDFSINPNPQYVGEQLNYNITANPNDSGDTITKYEWQYSSNGGATWSEPVTSNPLENFNTAGAFLVRGRVKDRGLELSGALWSAYCYKSVNIIETPNHKPIARFTVNPNPQLVNGSLNYNDTSYDNDIGDTIIKREWSYYNVQTAAWSDEPTETPPTRFDKSGKFIVALRVKDRGNNQYPSIWSEYCYQEVEILTINHKPIADFEMELTYDNHVIYIDKSTVGIREEEWDEITVYHWEWRKQNEDGTWTEWYNSRMENQDDTYTDTVTELKDDVSNTPPNRFLGEGLFQIRLKVKDKGNQLSPALWSEYCTKDLKVEDVKLFDFQITDIKDPMWKPVFVNEDDSKTGRIFKVNELPIDENSNDINTGLMVKKGYAFHYRISSKHLEKDNDIIRITPKFFYIDEYNNRIPVAMYYPTDNNPYVKVGSSDDEMNILFKGYEIGTFNQITLTKNQRIVKDENDQYWFGVYYIHPKAMFVREGYNFHIDNIIEGGRIMIQFQIEAYREEEKKFEYVNKQWNGEGGSRPGFLPGDVIIFDNKYNVYDDFESNVIF